MAMRSLSLLLLLVCASMSISRLAAASASDEAALLAFKAASIGGGGGSGDPLASWNRSSAGGYCSWEGVRCWGRHRRVVELILPSRGLTGILSPAIGNLSYLWTLNLSNNGFREDIPASLGRLQHLHNLDLSYNAFSGMLPANLSSCTSLVSLSLGSNQLHGRVPPELGDKLTHLVGIDLYSNNFTGIIPASLANLSSLRFLELPLNQFEGTITPDLSRIQGLQWLSLSYNKLSEDMSARVGDFGISRILSESAGKALQNSNSTIGIRGSIGYVAPEYGEGAPISTLGDVYSLGILLLEMFTGRSPTDDMFKGPMNLHKFSENALPDRVWEIADMTMWLHTDANDSTARSRIEKCLVSVIALGMSCSKKQPRQRTTIQDAATKMRSIRDSYEKETEVGHKQQQQLCNDL